MTTYSYEIVEIIYQEIINSSKLYHYFLEFIYKRKKRSLSLKIYISEKRNRKKNE